MLRLALVLESIETKPEFIVLLTKNENGIA